MLSHLLNDPNGLVKKAAARGFVVPRVFMLHAFAKSGNAEILAGSAECDDIDRLDFCAVNLCDISVMPNRSHSLQNVKQGRGFDPFFFLGLL